MYKIQITHRTVMTYNVLLMGMLNPIHSVTRPFGHRSRCTWRVCVCIWQAVCELGRETINTPVYVQMDAGECHVMTETMAAYTLAGEPRTPSSRAVKVLRLAAFAPHLPTSVDFNLRVYFVEDTQDALEVSIRSALYLCFTK